jgi:hypothetical protein
MRLHELQNVRDERDRLQRQLGAIDAAYPAGVGPVDGPWLSVLAEDWNKCGELIRKALAGTEQKP